MDDEELDRKVEQKIEEVLEEKFDGEVDSRVEEEVKSEIGSKDNSESSEEVSRAIEEDDFDRRSFLKILGLGAGGLALSSQASALSWTQLTGGSGGGGGDGSHTVSDSGTSIVDGPSDVNFRDGLSVIDDTDGTVTVDKVNAFTGTGIQKSGDGSTKTFTLSHGLSTTPAQAHVSPESEDASCDFWISNKTNSDIEITYAAAPPSGTNNLAYDLTVIENDGNDWDGNSVTQSGDGSSKSFTLSHSLGSTPNQVFVHATSTDASTDFWVTNKTNSDVTITYAAAPPSGSNNLNWDLIVV